MKEERMDKTPKYQKMCVEAFKDIGYIKPTASSNLMIPAPDSIHGQQPDDFVLSFEDEFDNIGFGSTIARPIGQLYQQDQLQKVLLDRDIKHVKPQIRFYRALRDFCHNADPDWKKNDYYMTFESFEQVWLALVMKKKYSKQWINGEWIENRK